MPAIIRTPEEIFRTENKDLYFIQFYQKKFECTQQELIDWIEEHLPSSSYERMAPSESSCYLAGYLGDLRIDFAEADLNFFCMHWETPEGKSLDERFQCFLKPYDDWFKGISQYAPIRTKPIDHGLIVWCDTPLGFIYHQIAIEVANALGLMIHPLSPRDLWFQAKQIWPELSKLESTSFIYGYNYFDKNGDVTIIYDHDVPYEEAMLIPERRQALLEWFNFSRSSRFSRPHW